MKNPLLNAREQLGLEVVELAAVTNTVEVTIRANEKGNNLRITKKLLDFLVSQGFDKEQLERDYEKYRQWKASQINQKIKQAR